MVYEAELNMLRDVFKKCHLKLGIFAPSDPAVGIFYSDGIFAPPDYDKKTVWELLSAPQEKTVYTVSDNYGRSYIYFLLTGREGVRIVLIGPYLGRRLTDRELLMLGEKNGASPNNQVYLSEYFSALPVISEDDRLLIMLHSFLERVFGISSFAIVNVNSDAFSQGNDGRVAEGLNDSMINIKTLESRYAFENELMEAVALGQIHKESMLGHISFDEFLEKRTQDSLRNSKNYCIIMNTLLRKAAERGGVHPVGINEISTRFAVKIEQLNSVSACSSVMREMFRGYCRLVRKSSVSSYSQTVQKTIALIDADLSAELTTGSLARAQGISVGYLSSVFCKEMGITLSGYIRKKRINRAKELLAATGLQIQTVALHCGIMDMQYFSKIFKKETGVTPKEYRARAVNKR